MENLRLDKIPVKIKYWWGVITILIIAMLLTATWQIKFTKRVELPLIIETIGGTSVVNANTSDNLSALVRSGEIVRSDQILFYSNDHCEISDVRYIDSLIKAVDRRFIIDSKLIRSFRQKRKNELNVEGVNVSYQVFAQELEMLQNGGHLEKLRKFKELKNAFGKFKKAFLLTSPRGGRIVMPSVLNAHTSHRAGDPMCFVTDSVTKFIGKIRVPIIASSKIRKGQTVLIKINNFNSASKAKVLGRVNEISPFAIDGSFYPASIEVENFVPNSELLVFYGTAEVIISTETIFDRLFSR